MEKTKLSGNDRKSEYCHVLLSLTANKTTTHGISGQGILYYTLRTRDQDA